MRITKNDEIRPTKCDSRHFWITIFQMRQTHRQKIIPILQEERFLTDAQ